MKLSQVDYMNTNFNDRLFILKQIKRENENEVKRIEIRE